MTRPRPANPELALAPPMGMRDLLPGEARARAELRRSLGEHFGRYGYEPVVTPIFELAEVIERGLDPADRRSVLRFVEPETGEVALLRPDITPQVARIVATSLAGLPGPHRLSYEGTLIRRRRGRARKQRQIFQVGGECVGLAGPEADVEAIEVAVTAARLAGLAKPRVELAHVQIARRELDAVPEAARADVAEALAAKDVHRLEETLRAAGVTKAERSRLTRVSGLEGGIAVLATAEKALGRSAAAELRALRCVADGVSALGLDVTVGIDLGELRGQSYYTGVSFVLLADGPGEPVGGGGRYDGLMRRFGLDAPATGFALDLENLEWALRAAGAAKPPAGPARFVVCGSRAEVVARALRGGGRDAATLAGRSLGEALAYASGWGYDCAVEATARTVRATRLPDRTSRALGALDPRSVAEVAAWVEQGRA